MDFRSMKRKDLQSLCKKYSIPANLSNLDMANKLSELFKEKEKPLIRGLSCLKDPDVNVSETESDVVENKKAKKVRFSPEHELIEFTRSREVKGRRTRKSMLRDKSLAVENVNTEKSRGRKLAKIDDIKDIVASIDVETEKVCEKRVNSPDRVMRSRRKTLVELLVNENNRGRIGVDDNVVLANVEPEESRVVNRRALRNSKMVDGGVKENVKEKEEVLENKEIVEENVNIEPQIVLRRSKRNAKKVEDEGARKYEIDGRRCSRKKHNELAMEASKFDADSATETEVEVEGKLEVEEVSRLEDPAKVQLRRGNRRKNTTDSNEKMENDEPVAENKDRYQLSTEIETGTSSVVPKDDVKVSHITGVTRRSRRRTMISQSVVETHKKLDDETTENDELREPTREPCLVEEGPVREENTRRSRRIASKHKPATKMDGKVNVPGKNEARKRKRVFVSGEDVIKAEDAIASEKAARMAAKGKVAQKRKQSSRVKKPSLVEASLLDMSSIPESSAVDAQVSLPQVVEITTNAVFSCTGIAMNITSDMRQTSCTKVHANKPDTSVEVSAGSFDAREVNGPELENREKSSLSKNVIMHFDKPECDLEISVGKSMEVVDKFHVPLEIAVENSFEDNICNSNMDESESMTKMEVTDAEAHKSANKTVSQSVNAVDHAVEHEVDIVQDNLDRVELEGVNELTSTIHSCPSDVDHLAASNQRFVEDDEDIATKATDEGVLDTCEETVNKISIQENKYAEDPGFYIEPVAETSFETDISSRIHRSDNTEIDANSMKTARILEERELSLSQDRICTDTDNGIIGEDTFLHDQNIMEYAKIGELTKKYEVVEPCNGEKSNTSTPENSIIAAIPENNIIEDPGKFASAGSILGINNFSSGDQLDVAEEDIVAFGLEGASEQKKQPLDMLSDDQEAYDVTEEDKTFVQEENLSDLAEIVKDDCSKNHETAPEISISSLFDGEKSSRTICDGEDSFKNANMHIKIADSPGIASPAMFGYCTEININASSSCPTEASLFRPNSIHNSLGNAGLESHNEKREDGRYSEKIMDELDPEKIYASVNEDIGVEDSVAVGSGEEIWSKQSNASEITILQPISCSQQGPAAVDDDVSFLLTNPLKGTDANTPVGVLKSLLSTHVDAEDSIQEKEASIGSKTAGFATSVHTIVSKGGEKTHTQASESSEDDENEPGLLVNLFATPVGIANSIRKKEAWSVGSKAAGDTMSLDKTSGKGADKSSNDDYNENQLQNPFNLPANNANLSEGQLAYDPAEVVDVAISRDFACNEVEFECQFGLATGSMDSEKINASVSEDITGKEIDTNRIETLHPINGAQRGPDTTDGELVSPFAAHGGDANTIPENEDLSAGRKAAGEAMSLQSTIREGDYGILGLVNENPEDDANQPGLLISLFATPDGNADTIQKKEAWSTGSKAAGDTMSLDRSISMGAYESNKDKNESQLQKSFNLPANNAKSSEERHDQNPAEIVDVTIPMDIACTKMEFESHFGLTTEIMDSEKIDASVSEDIREEIDAQQAPAAADSNLKSPFPTRVGYANTIQENGAFSIGSKTAEEATSVRSTISKGENEILRQENDSPEDDANEPGLLKSLFDTPIGVVNTTQENEAWRIGSISAGNTMFLEKTGSKGEHEIFCRADDSFSNDRNEIGDVAISMDSACNKMGFESFIQMKSHKTQEEECRIQIEHAGNMVSYHGYEFNNLFGTPIDRTNHSPPNETSSRGTEIADLTMSAEKIVTKMVSPEFFDRNFQGTEGVKGNKNEKTVQKCAVQQTPEEVSETSSDVGSEEDQLKVLFATPVNSATPCKENETSGSNASAAEQNANSEMVMEQSAVFQDLNERSNSETQRITTAEANETHTTFQNEDNIEADYGAKSPLLSYLEMHVPLKENKEMENSEADASNLNLEHDHLKNSEEVEENSTTMLIKQQVAMPDHQSEDNVEFRGSSLDDSVLPVSGWHETLKESDVADTIRAYIDSESTILVGVDDPTHVESIDNQHANLVEPQIQSHLKPVNADEENDKNTIESKLRKVEEEMQLVESACESKEADADLGIDGEANNALTTRKKRDSSWWDNQNDSHGKGSKKQHSIAKNVRTILIHGTPNKAITRGNMKENAPDSKRDNIGNLTTVRPAKRRALQDLQWK